jgi:hypothetical protein
MLLVLIPTTTVVEPPELNTSGVVYYREKHLKENNQVKGNQTMYNGVYIEEYKPPCARNMLLKSE